MRVAVIVNGPPGAGKSTLAGPLARELGLPMLAEDSIKETLLDMLGYADRAASRRIGAAAGETVWTVLSGCPAGAVIDTWLAPHTREIAAAGLARAGVDRHVEVWCDCPSGLARDRYAERAASRHPGHHDSATLDGLDEVLATAEPLGLGAVLRVRSDQPIDVPALTAAIRTGLRHHAR